MFGPPFTPYPHFQWYPQSKDILLNLYMKCWNSAFNAQGSRLIIVVVQFGAVKIYVAGVEALRRKERQDQTWFITKIDGFPSFIPPWMLMYFFARLKKISPCVWPNLEVRVLVLCFCYFTDNSNTQKKITWGQWCFVGRYFFLKHHHPLTNIHKDKFITFHWCYNFLLTLLHVILP